MMEGQTRIETHVRLTPQEMMVDFIYYFVLVAFLVLYINLRGLFNAKALFLEKQLQKYSISNWRGGVKELKSFQNLLVLKWTF